MPTIDLPLNEQGEAITNAKVGLTCPEARKQLDRGEEPHAAIDAKALTDTGCTAVMVAPEILDALRVESVAECTITTGGGRRDRSKEYQVSLTLSDFKPHGLRWPTARVARMTTAGDDIGVILGCDFLRQGEFVYKGKEGRFTLTIDPPGSATQPDPSANEKAPGQP